jgi:hypothetical protein
VAHRSMPFRSLRKTARPIPRAERLTVQVPARLTWKDKRGVPRFASVVTRNVSQVGAYVECFSSGEAIPEWCMVTLQFEREFRDVPGLPATLQDGRVPAAVYRRGPFNPTTGTPSGYALRLLIEPRTLAARAAQPEMVTTVDTEDARSIA